MKSRFTDESLNWRKLCRTAALEQDPTKLFQIVQRINAALKMHLRRLGSVADTRRNQASYTSSRLDRAA